MPHVRLSASAHCPRWFGRRGAGAALARLKHYRETFSADDYSAFHTSLASFVLVNSEFLILPFLGLNGTAADPAITLGLRKRTLVLLVDARFGLVASGWLQDA